MLIGLTYQLMRFRAAARVVQVAYENGRRTGWLWASQFRTEAVGDYAA